MVTRFGSTIGRICRHSGVRFIIVGGLSVGIDAGSLFLLHGVLGLWLPLATATAFLISIAVNFGLNRLWTFSASGTAHRHLIRYGSLVAMNLILTVVLVQLLTWVGMPYLVSKLCTTAVLSISNYFISRKWVFD